ncbi:lytic transglycosylase domain-containing protein [Martelella endophytica]|uniref:Lytic transglycosylase n=1 Tax=Martelella endophytica TaxID=1486262 RepID=A0A0D5LRM2_MAREN|nr:lytic transglycosylase domain-containing protein [Martelella endophytica]AJY46595.1 lytic transglycosylase [Martelella endophytica]
MKKTICMFSLAASVTAALIPVANAEDFPSIAPIPYARPDRPAVPPSFEITGAISQPVVNPANSSVLKRGLDALQDGDVPNALRARSQLANGSLDHQILSWAIAVSGERGVPSSEIAEAQQELRGWPGLSSLRANSERAFAAENPSANAVIAAFGNTLPETSDGTIVLTRALLQTGQRKQAHDVLTRAWTGWALDTGTENRILKEFGPILTTEDHKERMVYLLYRDRATQAERFSSLGDAQSFYKAWAAVIRRQSNAGALINAVHPSWHSDPGFLYIQIRNARQNNQYDTAAALLKKMPRNQETLVNADQWWDESRIIARQYYEDGRPRDAYNLVNAAMPEDRVDRLDAEFHAGWFALRGLKDGRTASRHFAEIVKISPTPISSSRSYYWQGRAAEAGGPGNARDFYRLAGQYSTTFYGQLALAKLGQTQFNVDYPSPTAADRANFQKAPAVQAINRLESVGHGWRTDALYRALAEQLTSPGELAILAYQAETDRSHALALQVGKIAYGKGVDVAALAFPTGVIPPSANISGSGMALAYAIARQESAFNPAAVSPADARGLLQLLPSTAQRVASRHGMSYSAAKLTTDPGYNATLGAHYLGEQIDKFGGSYILTFIAYNAGPARVPQWIDRFGDPRGKNIDFVVDWIESIPYPETRNYVQRIMENYEIYKARLGERTNIERDLIYGRNG